MTTLSALVLSLPAHNSTVRMRVWRALKDTGCGVLRDGVYVLPEGAGGAKALPAIESDIRAAGGFAMTVGLRLKPGHGPAVRKLFDRGGDYGALLQTIRAARKALPRLGHRRAQTTVERLERAFEKLAAIDFFPGQAKRQAGQAIAELRQGLREAYSRGEPRAAKKHLRLVDPAKYRKRVWATRKHPWVDRLASAWLIKRFIDREARFAWIERPGKRPKNSLGFDFDGAQFTHVGNRVTFEVLLASFGLEHDPALAALAAAVHYLDVGGVPAPEAKGLETMLKGAREKARSDDAFLMEAMRILDLLYSGLTGSRS
ncbi:MAG TPA: chromate resistance protein ChrB domain-containing protein [Burkholderiales bacterium]|nr:chromate resistance protein ChrB domain-containing protein [Burkholderiales bacterium]